MVAVHAGNGEAKIGALNPLDTFRVTSLPGQNVAILALSGELDLALAADIVSAGSECLAESTTQTLIVDLRAVTFIDSTAIGSLVHLRNAALERGKQLELSHMPERVDKLLKITGLDQVFTVTSD